MFQNPSKIDIDFNWDPIFVISFESDGFCGSKLKYKFESDVAIPFGSPNSLSLVSNITTTYSF